MVAYTFGVERQLAFPVHPLMVGTVRDQSETGRVILLHAGGKPIQQGELLATITDEFLAALGPEDVVWVPLYACCVDRVVDWPAPKLADYDEHLALIREIAPHVGAVMVGNMGPEMCWWLKSVTDPLLGFRAGMGAEFIRHHNDLIREAGGRPAYGTVDWDLICDCFEGGTLQAAIREADALQVCFCGFTMVAGCHVDRNQYLFRKQLTYIHRKGEPRLRDYLRATEVWSGVNFKDGLHKENDKHLAEFGFTAGICGGAEEVQVSDALQEG